MSKLLSITLSKQFNALVAQEVEFKETNGIIEVKAAVGEGKTTAKEAIDLTLSAGNQKSLSFEPSPENFRLLQKNIVLNGLEDRITPYNIALSDEKGTLDFELSNKNYGDNRVRKTSKNGQYGESERSVISIEANTFDSFLDANPNIDKEKIKLIWMDIQGHEGRFIKGAENFLTQHKNVPIAMEFWPYGIEANRKTLETLFRYSYEQGLCSRELTIEELFHPTTLKFIEP